MKTLSKVLIKVEENGRVCRLPVQDQQMLELYRAQCIPQLKNRRSYPDLRDDHLMHLYGEAQACLDEDDIPGAREAARELAEACPMWWTGRILYAISELAAGRVDLVEDLLLNVRSGIQAQLSGQLGDDIPDTVAPVEKDHLYEALTVTLFNLVDVYLVRRRDYDRALELIDEGMEVAAPVRLGAFLLNKAAALKGLGDDVAARDCYREAMRWGAQPLVKSFSVDLPELQALN